jgi:hypothetical protein
MSKTEEERKNIVKILQKKYRGLREEDLPLMNENYACVICAKKDCPNIGKYHTCCPEHEVCTEEEFAKRYDFEGIKNEN